MNIYDIHGINNFPRYFGYPSQILVRSLDDLKRQMQIHANRDPLYVSHNSHNREFTVYAQMFSEFDGHNGDLPQALLDTRKWYEYHKELADILLLFSGRGFHTLLKFHAVTIRMSEIAPRIREYQRHIKEQLDLKTMDLHVAEPGRLFRIPLSPYVYNENGVNIPTDQFDIPIDAEMLFTYDADDFIYLSKKKEYAIQEQIGKRLSISFLDAYEPKEQYRETEILEGDIDFYSFDEDYFHTQINDLMNDDTILIRSLLSVHPNHNNRRVACLKLKDHGLSANSACSFFERLSEIAQWDNRDVSIQRYQIDSIYQSNYKMREGRG